MPTSELFGPDADAIEEAGANARAAYALALARGEVFADFAPHFVVMQDGFIYQLMPDGGMYVTARPKTNVEWSQGFDSFGSGE